MLPNTAQTGRLLCLGLLATAITLSRPTVAAPAPGEAPRLSDTSKARLAALKQASGIDTLWQEARDLALRKVINPDDYVCGPTDFDVWIGGKFGAIEDFDAFVLIALDYGALDWATYYSMLFDHNATDDYIGVGGKQTREMLMRHRDNQRFWDVPTQDVLLQGMHGIYLADDAKMVPLVEFLLGVDAVAAAEIVDYVQAVIEADAGLGYANPLFTLNAFAVSARGEPQGSPFAGVPDKIVMGDGIIESLEELGLGDHGPDFVHAHEFAHHVQYELGVLDDYYAVPESELPEFTRGVELMADSLGAYYSAHARGAAFQARRIIETFRASYLIGDCAFDFPGHHGTPNQREAAARWGANLAASARKQGAINSAMLMLSLFEQQLPVLIAPDAP